MSGLTEIVLAFLLVEIPVRFRAATPRLFASVFLLAFGLFSARGQLTISNNILSVTFNTGSGQFSLYHFASGRTFVPQGNFNETSGSASIVTVSNAAFGAGQEIQFLHSDGNRDVIMVFSNVPFAFFQTTLTNRSASTVVSNKIHTLTAQVDLNESVSSLKAMGTGGLTTPSGNPGSYAWLAIADPQSRNGVVSAWLTSDRGSGAVFGKVNGSYSQVDAQVDYGRLQFLPGQTNALEIFAIGYFDDARVGLEDWADAVAKYYDIHLPPQPDGLCTYPMNQNGGASSPAAVAQLTDFVKTNLAYFGFNMIQFDAGWEGGIRSTNGSNHGPTRVFTEYTNAYSAGVKPTADYMWTNGITPGIWFEPFAGTSDDPYFTNHEDWFVETTNGTPYWCEWGGNSLDMTYPPAREYVSNMVSQIAHDWDYRYFKMDGFWTGSATPLKYVNSGYSDDHMGDAVFYDPSKPNIEAFRDGEKLVREAGGTNVFYLGCNIAQNMRSYSGSFGLLDSMRVGPDNGASWGSGSGNGSGWLRSPLFGTRHYFLQGRVWYNDPDTAYVRDGTFTLSEAQEIGSWYGISGQLTLDGDWIPGLSAERLNILKRILPHHGLMPRPVDYFENNLPNIWLLTKPATNNLPRRDVIGLFNWSTSSSLGINVTLAHVGLDTNSSYVGFNFWSNSIIPNISGSLQMTVPSGSCEIIAVRPQSGVPEVISTSRHVSQGIVSMVAEKWDGTNTLSGTSKVVENDPYELRIYSTNNWQLQNASVSAADQAAGVTVSSMTQTDGLTRVTLNSPTNREVDWSVTFSQLPTVTLTSPLDGQMYYTNDTILLSASTTDPSGTVTNVDFYNGATKIGAATGGPFNLSISNLAAGTYNFSAIATDDNGVTATSAVAQVEIKVFVPFTVSAAPAALTVSPGTTTNIVVMAATTNGYGGGVFFELAGLPAQVSASFNPIAVVVPGSGTLTLTVSNSVAPGNYDLVLLGESQGLTNFADITLVVSGTSDLKWNPASSVWDTNALNWLNLGSGLSDSFQNGDNVLFDDSGSDFLNVTIGSGIAVAPTNIVVSADVNDYTFSGSGKITGPTGLEKDGAGNLTVSTANDFTGPVVVNYGTLTVGGTTALGGNVVPTVVNDGGTLDENGINLTANSFIVSGQGFGGEGALVNDSGTQQIHGLGDVTLAGDATFGGTTRWDIRGGAARLSTGGHPYSLAKVGPNQLSIVGITVDSALSNVDIVQGVFAIQTTTTSQSGGFGNPDGVITIHNGAALNLWGLGTAPLNKKIAVLAGGTIWSESDNSILSGDISLLGDGFINVSNKGTAYLTVSGVMSGSSGFTKIGGAPLYLSGANTYSGNTTVGVGTLALTGNGAISNSAVVNVAAGATLDASGRSDATLTLAGGQTLSGGGTVNATTIVSSGATLAPGAGTLKFNNNLTLNGGSRTMVEVHKSVLLSPNNLQVTGSLVLGGTLVVTNVGAAYSSGQSFSVFSAGSYTGAFTNIVPAIPAVNLAWNTNNLGSGVLSIVASPTPPPKFRAMTADGSGFILSGTNGVPGWTYYVLASTNVSLPWTNWSIIATNTFDATGHFNFTNPVNPAAPQSFYLLQLK